MCQATGRIRKHAHWILLGLTLVSMSAADLPPVCSLEKPSALPGETILLQVSSGDVPPPPPPPGGGSSGR